MPTCYRHPRRETGVSCSSCGRPICPQCMTPTPVGMRCPECARQRTRVTRGGTAFEPRFPVTYALIALNVIVFLVEIGKGGGGFETAGGNVAVEFGLFGPFVAEGEVYRLLTYAFLHDGLFHIGFNMVALYFLGRLLEPAIGPVRFAFLYFASLFGGALGALVLSPDSLTIGASGAIFGIFGAAFLVARARGVHGLASSIGIILVINLVWSISAPHISLGGHLGGLVVGSLCGLLVVAGDRGRLGPNRLLVELVGMGVLAAASIVAALAVA